MGKASDKLLEFLKEDPNLTSLADALEPYLPALERLAADKIEDVTRTIAAAIAGDWDRVDEVLIGRMTHGERMALLRESHKLARAERVKQANDIAALRLTTAAMMAALLKLLVGLAPFG